MSIFTDHTVSCPGCDTPVAYELVQSVNVDRRPDLRDAVLDGSFQLTACPSCGTEFRLEPEFISLDVARGQYIGVWPSSKRGDWQSLAARTEDGFDHALGKSAPASAREVGNKLQVRAVFGWPALVEKVLARAADLDDRTLEAAKVVSMRAQEESPLPGRLELRMVGTDEGDPVVAWLGQASSAGDEPAPPPLRIPRQLLADIDAEPARWKTLKDRDGDGVVVDFQRNAF